MIDEFPAIEMAAPGDRYPQLQNRQSADVIDDVTRCLPHALGPEKSVLSALLQYPETMMAEAAECGITAGHFYLPAHTELYQVLQDRSAKGEAIEFVGLVQHLLDIGKLDRMGGPANLTDLYTYSPSPVHFRVHAQMMRDKYILRSLIEHSNETIQAAYDAPDEVAELLDSAEQRILSIRQTTETGSEVTTAATMEQILTLIQQRIEGHSGARGISTGYSGLDNMGCRLKPGEMFVIAARPSMGKTSLMMNIVENICIDGGEASMVFSLEMTRLQLLERLMLSRAKIASSETVEGWTPTKGDLQRMQRATVEISKARLCVNDQAGLTIGQLRAIARRKHKEVGLSVIAVDYLQLMRSVSKQAANSREREVAEISGGLKNLAKELNIPVVVLAQLNRGPEGRTGKNLGKPRLSDLRESGTLEQDADMVGLLYRAAYYADNEEDREAAQGQAELILAKNRNGQTGPVPLTFIAPLMRFESGMPAPEFGFQEAPKLRNRYDHD